VDALSKISDLRVVDFNWNDPSDTSFNNRNARGKWTGLIAQEVIDHVPYVVNAVRDEDTLEPIPDAKEPTLYYEEGDSELREYQEAVEYREAVYETVVTESQELIEWENKPTSENTKDEIKVWMDANELEYNSGDTKQDLLDKIPEVKQEAIEGKTEQVLVSEEVQSKDEILAVEVGDVKYQGGKNRLWGMEYDKLVPLLIKAIQELSAKVEALENA